MSTRFLKTVRLKTNMKAILVEYIDDCNNWAWYGVYINTTAEKAVQGVAKEMHEEEITLGGITKHDDDEYYYSTEWNEVRAIEVELGEIKPCKTT